MTRRSEHRHLSTN
uniref:Uncharacterized protein n=1 Tax=Arundo donax TaxID=35708 RepID=A0A0A8ZAW9_ARUDO